jgi:hypothetical protein
VRTPLRSLNPVWANLHYYADLWQATRSVRGWRARLHVWFGPPGGWTGEPLGHFDGSQFETYRPATPPGAGIYAMLQFALLVPCVSHLIAVGPLLPTPQLALYAAVIVGATLSLGALLEGRRFALRLEQARALAMGMTFALLPQWFGFDAPLALRASILTVMLVAVVWLDLNTKNIRMETT